MRYVDDPRCFEMLANAIVKQAADDYRNARKALSRKPDACQPKDQIRDVEVLSVRLVSASDFG